jgi:uncharacterized protein YukE
MGEGPLLGKRPGGKPGDLPTAKRSNGKGRTAEDDSEYSRYVTTGCIEEIASDCVVSAPALYTRPTQSATEYRNGIGRVTNQAAAVRAAERVSFRALDSTWRGAAMEYFPDLYRRTARAASTASAVQQSQSSAVRRCAAVESEMPRPPPSARQAAMHMGHFGMSARATLGSAHDAAPRARRAGRLPEI